MIWTVMCLFFLAAGCSSPGVGSDGGNDGDGQPLGDGDYGEVDGIRDAADAADGHWDAADLGDDGAGDSGDQAVECWADHELPGWVAILPSGAFLARCGSISLELSLLAEGILRLRYGDGQAIPAGRPSWAVVFSADPIAPEAFGTCDGRLMLRSSALRIRVDPDRCRLLVEDPDGTVLLEDPDDGGFSPGPTPGAFRVSRVAEVGEHFYGLGEKTGGLDRRGRIWQLRTSDPFDGGLGGYPPEADPLYQAIGFLVGLRGATAYGLLTDNAYRSIYDLAASDPGRVSITVDSGRLDQYLLAGPSLAQVLERYTRLTGRPSLPPRWVLGYHQSRWGYSPADRVRQVAAELRARAIPADAIWLDIQHMDGFRSFTFDPVAFADPAGLLSDLRDEGFVAVAIVDPGLKADQNWDIYQAALAGGYLIGYSADQPWLGEVWPGQAAFPDFSSAAARAWWASLVPRLTVSGVAGIWLDMNEPTTFQPEHSNSLPDDLPVAGDGWPNYFAELHNAYALLEARATYQGLEQAAPDRRPFILTRAGFAGIQRYAAVWTGDAHSSWDSLRGTLPMLLGLGLSGVDLCGSDVGGYSGGPTPELFARWMQLGAISPFFRDHVNTDAPDQEPWAFGPEVEAISRAVIQERYRLLPYLYSLLHQAHECGAPLLRPLVWEFQSDPATYTLDDQAMLGPFLLLAPVMSEGAAERSIYLPAGRWFELHSGAVFEGPTTVDRPVSLAAWPAFVRAGAILPRADVMQHSGQQPVDPLYLEVYPDPAESSFELVEDEGDGPGYSQGRISRTSYRLRGLPNGALLQAAREGDWSPPARAVVVRVRRVDYEVSAVRLSGTALSARASYQELLAAGQGYFADPWDRSVVVAFADRPEFRLELDYDPALLQPEPWVEVPFRVRVPDGTPAGDTIYVASSANGWSQLPLSWTAEPNLAAGRIPMPRGAWFEYKITRGDWATVEKWAGCAEADNRYGLAAAWPVREDTVATWADWCR